MILIAKWPVQAENDFTTPESIHWDDGSPASLQVFREHMDDTQMIGLSSSNELELHMFPDIVAEVFFEEAMGCWCVRGRGVIPKNLDLIDPMATDIQIAEVMSYSRVGYRIKVSRD